MNAFKFTQRTSTFDWKQLHGTDLEEVVHSSDVAAIEALLPMLQKGRLDREPSLSLNNCMQLVKACQLAVQYLQHLKDSHLQLISSHQHSTDTAHSWKAAAQAFIAAIHDAQQQEEGGTLLVLQPAVSELQQLRSTLELCDQRYNDALDKLEEDDRRCRHFRFNRRRLPIDWRLVHSVDMRQLESPADPAALEELVEVSACGDVAAEQQAGLSAANLRQLVAVSQAVMDYLRGCAASSGAALAEEMQRLAAESAEIPALTTEVQQAQALLRSMVARMTQQRQAGSRPASRQQQQEQQQQRRQPSPDRAASPPLPWPGPPCIGVPVQQYPPWPAYQLQPPPAQMLPLPALLPLAGALSEQNCSLRKQLHSLEKDLRQESERTQDMRHALRRIEEALRRPPSPPPQVQIVHVPVPSPQAAVSSVHYSRRSTCSSPSGSASPSRRGTTESTLLDGSRSPSRRIHVLVDEEGLRSEEREHSVAALEQQVLGLKRKVLQDHMARRSSSRSTSNVGRASRLDSGGSVAAARHSRSTSVLPETPLDRPSR